MLSPTTFLSSAFSLVVLAQSSVNAFSSLPHVDYSISCSSTRRSYRSIHHGPDVEPLTEGEKFGAQYTKMKKDLIKNYGPSIFDGFADVSDQFDGGDSEMGLSGDGCDGLQKLGRYVLYNTQY